MTMRLHKPGCESLQGALGPEHRRSIGLSVRIGALPAAILAATLALSSQVASAAPGGDMVIVDDEEQPADEPDPLDAPDDAPPDSPDEEEEAPNPTSSKAPKSGSSGKATASVGGGAEADGESKRTKKSRPKQERQGCHSKPFDILDCVPENHTLEIGMHMGVFILSKRHGLFDPSLAPQPSLRRGNFDVGFRALYLPIPYVGAGFETTIMPAFSPSENSKGTMYTVRGHVVGQAPWRITPTFLMGGGLLAIKSDNPLLNSGSGFFYYGPGGKFYIQDWVAVRVEARHIVSANDSGRVHNGEVFAALDLTLRIGKWVERSRARKFKDADNDGYPDAEDKCPNAYSEDNLGCPADRDSDGDGVMDSKDRCPEEYGDGPGGCPVPDQDGDGILDSTDSCVDQAENYNGFEDQDGCPDEEPAEVKAITGVIAGIQFDSGKAKIKKESRAVLDQAIETLTKYPQLRLKIIGYTDDVGKRETNEALSATRAEAVKKYMVDAKIEASRLETSGRGPENPIADNSTKEGRASNRRIEFERLADGAAPASTNE